jgi:hypothetical protein
MSLLRRLIEQGATALAGEANDRAAEQAGERVRDDLKAYLAAHGLRPEYWDSVSNWTMSNPGSFLSLVAAKDPKTHRRTYRRCVDGLTPAVTGKQKACPCRRRPENVVRLRREYERTGSREPHGFHAWARRRGYDVGLF